VETVPILHTDNFSMYTSTQTQKVAMSFNTAKLLLFLFMLTFASVSNVANATLGGDRASVEANRVQGNVKQAANHTMSATGTYTVYETTMPSGTTVRQYVSTAGVVFAVAWTGQFKPDLRQLMGPHFDKMVARQADQGTAGQRFILQHETDLVVEAGGHPRSFVGRAWLPNALPPGISVQDIQ